MVRVISMAAVVSCFLFGCGGKSPPELCDEMVGALSAAASRCGFDGVQAREALLDSIGGSCQAIVDIRDEDALEDDCLPWLRRVGCDVLTSDEFATAMPSSCKGQLIHK